MLPFEVKGLLAPWLLPPVSLFLLIAAAVIVAGWWPRTGRGLAMAGAFIGVASAMPAVSTRLIGWVEAPYAALDPPPLRLPQARLVALQTTPERQPQAIVLLAGGVAGDGTASSAANRPSAASLERIVHASRLVRLTGLPLLVSGGIGREGGEAEARLLQAVLEADLSTSVRWTETESRDTAENATFTAGILQPFGIRRILLVTHAYHMTRAESAFRRAGFVVTPAPHSFQSSSRRFSLWQFVPSLAAVSASHLAAREIIGQAWYLLNPSTPRTRIDPMTIFDRSALNPGVRGREVLAWSSYDFANSGYTTVVLTAVFNAYFVGVVADGADWGTLAWTAVLGISNLAVLLTMPAIGALADRRASKKPLMGIATIGCVAATAGLAWCGRGDLALAALLIVVSNYFYAMGEALCGAFLPELARPAALGKVSGWGWSFGYLGGMLALGLSLTYVISAQGRGDPAEAFVPVTMLITAGIFAVAALPTFLVLRERAQPQPQPDAAQRGWLASLLDLREAARRSVAFPDFRRLLWTGAAYQAGISVVIALAAVYAEQVMGFAQQETMALIFLVNIASTVGAFLFGYAQDRIGHKPALAITLVAWIVMVLIASFTSSRALFWMAAALAGLCMGSSQSCGRALVAVLAPAQRSAEFYGLWAFATRIAAVVGPLTYGLISWATAGNHRVAFLATGLFFVAGLFLLARMDLQRGEKAAAAGGRVGPPEAEAS